MRASHVCVWTLFCAVGQFWVCGILVRVFCWAIADGEYSFHLIFGFYFGMWPSLRSAPGPIFHLGAVGLGGGMHLADVV